jgi:hypothetical protein
MLCTCAGQWEVNKMTVSLTNGSYMLYESRGFKVGVIAGVGSKINIPKKFRQPLLSKVEAPNRGYCWSCSKYLVD